MKQFLFSIMLMTLAFIGGYTYHAYRGVGVQKHTGHVESYGCLVIDNSVCFMHHPDNTTTVMFFVAPFNFAPGGKLKDIIYVDRKVNGYWKQDVVKFIEEDKK